MHFELAVEQYAQNLEFRMRWPKAVDDVEILLARVEGNSVAGSLLMKRGLASAQISHDRVMWRRAAELLEGVLVVGVSRVNKTICQTAV